MLALKWVQLLYNLNWALEIPFYDENTDFSKLCEIPIPDEGRSPIPKTPKFGTLSQGGGGHGHVPTDLNIFFKNFLEFPLGCLYWPET